MTAPRVLLSFDIRVQHGMEGESPHVPLMELWGYASGTANLLDDHFEHLLFCVDCQALVNQFMEVLDGLSQADPDSPSQAA